MKRRVFVIKVTARLVVVFCAAGTTYPQVAAATGQTETDEYTRNELLSPESASFAIRYAVTATTAGASITSIQSVRAALPAGGSCSSANSWPSHSIGMPRAV